MELTKEQFLTEYQLKTDSVDLGDGKTIAIHEVPLKYISEMMQLAESDPIKMAEFAVSHGSELFKSNPELLEKIKPSILLKIGSKIMEITNPYEDEIKNSESDQV